VSGAQPATYSLDTGVFFSCDKTAGAWSKLFTPSSD